uniref:Homeobox domain-containing protein n=1 Tax=Strongyloides papillosus TaxID=174720 RepID=A0A0N5B4P8_STREA
MIIIRGEIKPSMEGTFLNVIIEPLLNIRKTLNLSLCERHIKRTIIVSPDVVIENICGEVLTIVGLGHLTNTSEASVFVPNSKFSPDLFCLSRPGITVGHLKGIFGDQLYIKISAKGEPTDFTEESMNKNLFINLIRVFIKEVPFVESHIVDPFYRNLIEKIKTPSIAPRLPGVTLQSLVGLKQLIDSILCDNIFTPVGILNEQRLFTNTANALIDNIARPTSNNNNNVQNVLESTPSSSGIGVSIANRNSELKPQEQSSPGYIGIPIRKPSETKEPEIMPHPTPSRNELNSMESEEPQNESTKLKEEVNTSNNTEEDDNKYQTPNENDILERWYKRNPQIPSFYQLSVLAQHLNTIYERPPESQLTGEYLFWWYTNPMEYLTVNLIIEPVIGNQHVSSPQASYGNIKMTVTIDPTVLIKDICQVVMNKIGLGHLIQYSQAFIKYPRVDYFVSAYCFTNQNATVGNLEEWHKEYVTVKICARGNVEDFCGFEGRNTLYRNLLQLLLKKYPFIRNQENDPFIREAIDRINDSSLSTLQHSYLYCVNEVIVKELVNLPYTTSRYNYPVNETSQEYEQETIKQMTPERSLPQYAHPTEMTPPKSVQSIPTPYRSSSNQIQSPSDEVGSNPPSDGERPSASTIKPPQGNTSPTRKRIIFNKTVEIPILEDWYKKMNVPSEHQLDVIAEILNEASGRSEDRKVTAKNVCNWFTHKRSKDKRGRGN